MAAEAGADLVGLVGPMPSGAGIVSPGMCREIATRSPAWVTPVLLTSSETSGDIIADIRHAGVRAVQLVRHVDPSVHEALEQELPHVRRFQVIHVEGAEALDLARTYPKVEAFVLDSGRPGEAELGGTGRTHDWVISTAFVKESPVPVFLAGGLTPGNVPEAIALVRPFGIDICSGVRTDDKLDGQKLSAFMAAVDEAE